MCPAKRPQVFLLEDNKLQRETLTQELQVGGFDVCAVGSIREARKLICESGCEFDVAILDMLLEDPDEPQLTGADLGEEIRTRQRFPPEFIVYSAHVWRRYYQQAIRLGVADYLEKVRHRNADVVRHARIFSIRRALRHPNIVDEIGLITSRSRDQFGATFCFCRDILMRKLRIGLDGPLLLLLTDLRGPSPRTVICEEYSELPLESGGESRDPWGRIAALTFTERGGGSPLRIDPTELSRFFAMPSELGSDLSEFAFVPLAQIDPFRLILGIGGGRGWDERLDLCELVQRHLQGSIVADLVKMVRSIEIERRNALLRYIGDFCSHVGQKQRIALDQAGFNGEIRRGGVHIDRLGRLSQELQDAGGVLSSLVEDDRGAGGRLNAVPTDMPAMIQRTWLALLPFSNITMEDKDVLKVSGKCSAAVRDDEELANAIAGILRWLGRRGIRRGDNETPLRVTCAVSQKWCEIWFEDSNPRLIERLREDLFEPFFADYDSTIGLGLFLAKNVVELRYEGSLECPKDQQPQGEIGNRIRLRLPASDTVAENLKWTSVA